MRSRAFQVARSGSPATQFAELGNCGVVADWMCPLPLVKQALDLILASICLTICLPVMMLLGVAVRLTSPGPALYHQRRVGLFGRTFSMHKFRTMRVDAEAQTGPVWASTCDPRVTPVGRFLRQTHLDELPQLWNVLKGEMSIIGPRPERPEFLDELTRKIPSYGQRHLMRPGITGWAQVRYTYGATIEDAREKLRYDLFYIKNLTVALELLIMFETIKIVVLRRGT